MASATDHHVGKEGLFEKFKELGIEPLTVDHPEVITITSTIICSAKAPIFFSLTASLPLG